MLVYSKTKIEKHQSLDQFEKYILRVFAYKFIKEEILQYSMFKTRIQPFSYFFELRHFFKNLIINH